MSTVITAALPASADVAPGGTAGSVQLVAAPPSLAAGQVTSDTAIRVINEQSLTLTIAVAVVGVGTNGWTTVKTVAASTCVQSHLVHVNRATTTGPGTLTGSVTFNSDVVGVATDLTLLGIPVNLLSATDPVFRNPATTTYPTGTPGRGLETGDQLTLPSARTVNLSLAAGPDMDELRVITLCDQPNPVVPEAPFAILLPLSAAAVGGLLIIRRRRPAA